MVERSTHKADVVGSNPTSATKILMPIYRAKNENFFKKWSSEMAYILGYIVADGSLVINPRGSRYLEIQSTDGDLLSQIKRTLGCGHKISTRKRNEKWKIVRRLQIGSKKIFNDLLKHEVKPRKTGHEIMPEIPDIYVCDFVRGYFDGDGCISFGIYPRKARKSNAYVLSTRFISGNKKFLESLLNVLKKYAKLRGGFIVNKNRGFELCFSINDSKKLYRFIYGDVPNSLFLERKYNKFQKALKIMEP